ncbi:DNA repair protein RadA, partial [Candidatus Gracilibacteria bacterium]|nr:DNA repair protein RadA [Candidatus Gracilibacteria bacterium]
MKELKNPSEFFLAERAENAAGSAITVMREGARNFLIEIQALTVKTNFGQPRRTSHGLDLSKFHLLLAVVSKFTPFRCEDFDAYLNVVSGMKAKEPAVDLAVVAAVLSSRAEKEIPADTVILGEVGLSGEIRSVAHLQSRLTEAEKLGFTKAIVSRIRNKQQLPKKMKVIEVKSVQELVKAVFEGLKIDE